MLMFLWGELFFGVELHRHLAGFLVMAVVTALASSAFGLMLASLCRTRMQLVALANLLDPAHVRASVAASFRGSDLRGLQRFGLLTLNAWAIDGFLKVFWRDAPLTALAPQVAFLVGAAVVLFTLARRLARRWEVA